MTAIPTAATAAGRKRAGSVRKGPHMLQIPIVAMVSTTTPIRRSDTDFTEKRDQGVSAQAGSSMAIPSAHMTTVKRKIVQIATPMMSSTQPERSRSRDPR